MNEQEIDNLLGAKPGLVEMGRSITQLIEHSYSHGGEGAENAKFILTGLRAREGDFMKMSQTPISRLEQYGNTHGFEFPPYRRTRGVDSADFRQLKHAAYLRAALYERNALIISVIADEWEANITGKKPSPRTYYRWLEWCEREGYIRLTGESAPPTCANS